ncbi:predicted protein [Naegleria gruberi]|uniref:Predicted protein n=1 Tax=Naegleria gruberi TaxID=5762 RepID=D2VE98_NAEGR|nr:uncharacterized protein NAEGRDRAFT_67201 [Naegleria gruberi]EFC44844.1 predicted protein [Naegleria gruberi]|eukprot:XP_002677588.1 predicted protein [Naegleria gruberi strain NEG-M]
MYNSAAQSTPVMNPTTSSRDMACQECLSKVPGLDYAVPPSQSIMLRNYTPPEYPTVVYVPQRQCQPQYNNLVLPQYQCADQPSSSRFATSVATNIRSSTPVYGRTTLVAQQESAQTTNIGCGCGGGAQVISTNQQQIPSMNTSNNQIPIQPGTFNYPSKKPCCYPESGSTNNPKYLQEVEGQEFLAHFPNKKYNRKKINLEAVKEQRPKMNNKWVTEHRENFGFFSCSAPVGNEAYSSSDSISATNSQQQLFISPTIGQPQMNPTPTGLTQIYNPDYYQQGLPITPVPTPATGGNEDYQDVFEPMEEPSATPAAVSRPKSPSLKKRTGAGTPATKKEPPKKEVTKVEPPPMSETIDRRSRGAYSEDNGSTKDKKKTKQEMYAEVYNRTLSKIQQKETNQKKKLIDRQDQYYGRLAAEEKQTIERNQRELQTYMNRGEKPPFFPYGHSNVTPVSDKTYMNTFNVAPRDPNQIVKDVVARREKTAEYDGWKKLLDEQDFKPWKPKSYYWKSFDRFEKYNNESRRERNSYGGGNNDLDDKIDSAPVTTTKKRSSSRPRKEEKKTAFVEPIEESDEEKENIRQYNEQPQMNSEMKARNSDYYSPEEYQMMYGNQQMQSQYPSNNYPPQQMYQGGNYPVGPNTIPQQQQYVYADQVQANNTSTMVGQSSMINCEAKRANYEGPLCSDLKGLQFAKFIPKDYSDFNPKNYKALPIHYLNYIRPAGKVTPSNDAISECFRFYD